MPLASTYTRLHRHTCTIQRGTVVTTADPYHPGSANRTVDWATIAATNTAVRCRLARLDSIDQSEAERTGGGTAGTVVATHYLYLARSAVPATLLDQDSVPAPELQHRIVNLALYSTGTVFDTGPFDIQRILDLAGQGDVMKLELKRIT